MHPAPLRVTAATLALLASAYPAAADVRLDGGRCPLVDEKPFFAIGIYSAGNARDLPILAQAGFNLVHTYAWEGKSGMQEEGKVWLDAVHASGMKALVGLYRPDVKGMNLDACIPRIEAFRDHPALLAWHTMDEPAWDKPGDSGKDYMPAAHRLIREHDPNHPVTAVICHFHDTKLFEPAMDICQADYYCVPPIPADWYSGTGFRGVKLYADKWRDACGGAKPFWYVGQIFDFSVSKEQGHEVPEEWKRMPTREELRCATYTAVASGARGVLYWSLSRLMSTDWHRSELDRVVLWQALVEVVGELNRLMPILTAPTDETILEQDRVVALIKSDGKDIHIIAANYEREPAETVLDIPGVTNAMAEGLFDGTRLAVEEGKLRLSLGPLGTAVYRVIAQ